MPFWVLSWVFLSEHAVAEDPDPLGPMIVVGLASIMVRALCPQEDPLVNTRDGVRDTRYRRVCCSDGARKQSPLPNILSLQRKMLMGGGEDGTCRLPLTRWQTVIRAWQLTQKQLPPPQGFVSCRCFAVVRPKASRGASYLFHDVFPFRNPVVITLLLSCLHHLAKALTPLVAP